MRRQGCDDARVPSCAAFQHPQANTSGQISLENWTTALGRGLGKPGESALIKPQYVIHNLIHQCEA
jgi:hypothetical protein